MLFVDKVMKFHGGSMKSEQVVATHMKVWILIFFYRNVQGMLKLTLSLP